MFSKSSTTFTCYIRRASAFQKKKKESLQLILVWGGNGFDLVYGF